MKNSVRATLLNVFLKYGVKPFQAHIRMTPGRMKHIRNLVNMGEPFYSKLPDHVSVSQVQNLPFRGEWLSTPGSDPDRVILYIHGGAFFSGSPLTHRPITWRLAHRSGIRVFSLDYRLIPEHSLEDAMDDAVGAYTWLLDGGCRPEHVVIGGDSAGGGLTLMTLLRLKALALPEPAAAFCLSPFVDYTGKSKTLTSNAGPSIMFHANLVKSMEAYIRQALGPQSPLISPDHADFSGMPSLYLQVSDNELLFDESIRIVDKYKDAGQSVDLHIWHNLPHVFALFADLIPEGRQCIDNIAGFVRKSFDLQGG